MKFHTERLLAMEKYKQMLLDMGSNSVTMIEPKSIVSAPWVIYKCQFGCAFYGKSHCCPPQTPTYKETQEMIDSYTKALIFRCPNSLTMAADIAVKVAKEMFFDGYYKAIVFGAGPCLKCKECNPEKCNFPGATAPSMEACGIDVYQTVRNNGYQLDPIRSKDEAFDCFGLILVE